MTDDDYCDKLYDVYKKRVEEGLKINQRRQPVIPKLAEERGLFPWMTFKAIATRFLAEEAGASVSKKIIQQCIKNPHSIKNVQLQLEAIVCSTQDQLQGIITDSLRHVVGKDYEQILERQLKEVIISSLFFQSLTFIFRIKSRILTKKPNDEWAKTLLLISG